MIIEVRAKNCFIFAEEIAFSMQADMRNKKFSSNIHKENNFNVLKTAGIYGPNNSGKTCLIKCIAAIKQILLNIPNKLMANLFTNSDICELGITFLYLGRKFDYNFKYNQKSNEFIYESFAEISKDNYNNETVNFWLEKDCIKGKYKCIDKELEKMIPIISKNNLLYYLIDVSKFNHMNEMKNILINFANKIDILNMNNIPLSHTIDIMKNKNNKQQKIVDFIKNSDLYLENFEYVDDENISIISDNKPDETALYIKEKLLDQIKLTSTYKGIKVPSMIFDSTGTKKIAALASYVIDALESGRILIIDELDSSIHFKLTRDIVNMFNNELNRSAQIIFTIHDINLMDCKKMFRKEQIWFVQKDDEGVYVYSLADFTAKQGVRDTTDIIEKYKKGALGALPDPELINTLLNINGNKPGKKVD